MEKEKLIRLVTDAQSGSDDAISEIYNTFHNDIYYIALRETKNPDTALDITQEAFIEIIQTINKLQEPAAFVTWMKAIAYHQCTRYYKKKDVKHELIIDEQEDMPSVFEMLEEENEEFIPDKALDNEDFKETIRNFVGELPEAQRTAIMMKYFDEMSVKQIAEIQGVPENTVLSRLNYGRKAIKSSVEDYEKKHNIKLHAIPFFPLFKWLFDGVSESMSIEAATATAESIAAATGTTITVTATSASVAATTATSVGATAANVGLGAKIASLPLVTKIIAGIIAASIVIGVPTATITLLNDKEPADQTDSGNGNSIVEVSNTIPEGCEYHINDDNNTILYAGDKFPDTCITGDRFYDKYYYYSYNYCREVQNENGEDDSDVFGYYTYKNTEQNGWSAHVLDHSLSEYPIVLESINGENVTNLNGTYAFCKNMISAPQIPKTITSMEGTFFGCENLKMATIIIPEQVKNLSYTFKNCLILSGPIVINSNAVIYDECFLGTKRAIVILGGISIDTLYGLRYSSKTQNIDAAQFTGSEPLYEIPEYDYEAYYAQEYDPNAHYAQEW